MKIWPVSLGTWSAFLVGVVLITSAFVAYHLFDFRIFYDASRRLVAGHDLYPSQAQIEARTRDYYVLPPLVSFLTTPLSYLPFPVAATLWALVSTGALVAAMRLLGVDDIRCYVALLFWMPVLQTVGLGTIEPVLVLALALAWRYRDAPCLGSVALGLAIAAKLFLWPLLVWLIATRRLRRAVEAAAATLVALLVPWAADGFRQLTYYPHMLQLLTRTEQRTSWGVPSSSLVAPAAIVACVVAVAAIVALSRAREADRRAFTAAVIAALLVSPIVWLHYYVVLIVPIALAARRFGWIWLVPALAVWPFTDTHELVAVRLWAYAVLAAVALFTLTRVGTSSRSVPSARDAFAA